MPRIASLLELDPEVVRLFEALFFKVRDRGEAFRTGVMFPEARIGAVVEAEMNYHEMDFMLMRVGRDYGWKEVARLAGLRTMEEDAESASGTRRSSGTGRSSLPISCSSWTGKKLKGYHKL